MVFVYSMRHLLWIFFIYLFICSSKCKITKRGNIIFIEDKIPDIENNMKFYPDIFKEC